MLVVGDTNVAIVSQYIIFILFYFIGKALNVAQKYEDVVTIF